MVDVRFRVSSTLTAFALAVAPASAASSSWETFAGGRVALVTSGVAGAGGKLRGALMIDLAPGWKTYWRDPGDAGVPPSLTLADGSPYTIADIGFPAPQRIDDGATKWAGYKHPVALPLTFEADNAAGTIEADVFLGVCETICIPVQARLVVEPALDPDNADDFGAVEAAFAALPAEAGPGFGAAVGEVRDDALVVSVEAPGEPAAVDLFVASPEGYVLGTPERVDTDGRISFAVPVFDQPTPRVAGAAIAYTLVAGETAVSGTLVLP
ncbi:MAG: protein-disulfide reductase DsbD domain-containing protein [Rhizobiaceae bacterium]